MRKLTPALVACLTIGVPALAMVPPASAKPPKADLVAKQVTASLAAGRVTAGATVKNKGAKRAAASFAAFYLSADTQHSGDDVALGSAAVGRIKPKKSKPAHGTFAVPSSVPSGTYHVVVCADSGGAVKERKETNNCKGSSATVTVTGSGPGGGPGGGGSVTVSATAGAGGTVAASAITGGTCAATTCTFPSSGTGTVTFTPTPAGGHRFGAWTGATCTGFTTGAGNAITFTNPTSAKACTASFVQQVTVTYAVAPVQVSLVGKVTATATGGSCTDNVVTGGGSCIVDASTGTVTLTATQLLLLHFVNWSGDCTGATNPLQLTNLSTAAACTANFSL